MAMPDLTREVTVHPAYDCIEVQPCVKRDARCGVIPGATHGRAAALIGFALYSPVSEVRLILDTGWQHTATPNGIRGSYAAMNLMGELGSLNYHSAWPLPDPDGISVSGPAECPRGWDTCCTVFDFGKAQHGAALLVDHGSNAVWAWLEQRWRDRFAQAEGAADRG